MRTGDVTDGRPVQAAGGMAGPEPTGLPPGTSFVWFIIVMGFLTMFGPMAIDMYLPAFPAMRADLGATEAQVQITLSAFVVSYGFGQLIWGPLGDRYGRKKPAAVGIVLYIIASAGCALASDIWALMGWRVVQGVAACAAPVIARAAVRDAFERDRAASVMSLMMLVMGVAPMLAPLAGGQLLNYAGWRWIFWCIAGFGVLAAFGLMTVKETRKPATMKGAHGDGVLAGYLLLLLNRHFLHYALSSAFVFSGMFAYIAGTPFIYIQHFGVAPEHFGFLFSVNVFAMMASSALNSRLVLRLGVDRMLSYGVMATGLFGSVLLVTGGLGIGGIYGIAVPLFFFLGGLGLVGANGVAGALALFPHLAGTASALVGAMQLCLGAVASGVVGLLADGGSPLPMCAVLCGCAVAGYFTHRLTRLPAASHG